MTNNVGQNQNFLDSKTIMAIILVGLCWVGWQFYMQQKYPDLYKNTEQQIDKGDSKTEAVEKTVESIETSRTNSFEASEKNDELSQVNPKTLPTLRFEDEIWSFDITPEGMGLKNIELKKYKNRDGNFMHIGSTQEGIPFASNVIGNQTPLFFDLKKTSDNEFMGKAQFGSANIEKRITINSEQYLIDTKIMVTSLNEEDKFSGLSTFLGEKLTKQDSGIPFLPQFERQEIFVKHDDTHDRMLFHEEDSANAYQKVKLVSLSTQYFTQAILDKSDIMPEVKTELSNSKMYAQATLNQHVINRTKDFYVNYIAFAGPKSIKLLTSIDENLSEVVDLGWFSGLAKLILNIMKLFHSLFGNWGIAIILLTILVRFIVLPFNLMSIRSMKKMQAVQPQIQKLREKHKEDPQKLNQEMMQLFKAHKVNPMGGCLPMLLQFPVFIALYQMLGQSIELYQAPFIFWIKDLSLKDPYYVLPILMGITMYIQQKVTPTTMDPTQQKIFMFMPIIFSLFMITLPSGLTLYIFVSALFAVIQQVIVMRDKNYQTQLA